MSSPNVRGKNQARFLGQDFGTGTRGDAKADWYIFGLFWGQGFGTPEPLISGPFNFVPKLTVCETVRRQALPNASVTETQYTLALQRS